MMRRCLIGGLGLAVLGSSLLAKPGVVRIKESTDTFAGDVVTDDASVTITNKAGIQTKVQKANVASIEYTEGTGSEQFAQQLAKLAPTDVDGRITLARQAYEARQYENARLALDDVLRIDPNNSAATEMLDMIGKQVRLERSTGTGANPRPPEGAAPGMTAGGAMPAPGATGDEREQPPGKLLSPADINTIRQHEWSKNDINVRVRLKGDVKKRYIAAKALDTKQFNASTPVEQARAILADGGPEMTRDVEILSDPASMAEFRRQAIQGKLLVGCASAPCHGTAAAGGFQLFSPADNEAIGYTNFYILQKYTKNLDGRVYQMIDRAAPQNSLLIQYGLPADLSEVDHPPVAGYRGIFRTRNDATYKAIEMWMGQTLSVVAPDYGIDYKSPGGTGGATQPAATPPPPAGMPPTPPPAPRGAAPGGAPTAP